MIEMSGASTPSYTGPMIWSFSLGGSPHFSRVLMHAPVASFSESEPSIPSHFQHGQRLDRKFSLTGSTPRPI